MGEQSQYYLEDDSLAMHKFTLGKQVYLSYQFIFYQDKSRWDLIIWLIIAVNFNIYLSDWTQFTQAFPV